MKKIFTFIIILLISINIFAQNNITGTILDKTTKKPLPFANIYLPELDKGTVADEKGEFTLNNLPKGEIKIQFSYTGYKPEIMSFFSTKKTTELEIELEIAVMQTEQIVISGGSHSSQHQNAIKIELLKPEDITLTGSQSFIGAIANVPGVDMISKGAGVGKPVIRGLSMTNILMLNNGIKMENFQFSENHPFIIDEFGVSQVEVIKGPASLLYGSDAVGGVINVIKEKPAPVGKIIGDYNLQLHSNTLGAVSNLGLKGSSEKFFWGFRAGKKSHSDYKDGNNQFIPNTRFNEKSFKANFGINKSFGLFRIYYDYNQPKLGMSIDAALPFISENGRKNEIWYQDLTNHIISTKNTLFLGDYKIRINGAYQMNNRKLQTSDLMPFFEMVDMNLNTLSYDVKTCLPSTEKSEYIIGFQGANKRVRNMEAPNHIIPDANVDDLAFFGLFQYTFFEKLKTQAGVRYDFRLISTFEEPNKPKVDTLYNNVSGSLGATFQMNEKILFRANFASAYRTPNIAELTQNGMHGNRFEQGNAALKSQRNYEADISTHFHTKHLMIDVSGFYNRIFDYIFIAPTDDTTSTGTAIYRYSQTNATLYGGEIAANFLPVNWFDIKTTYSYLVGIRDDGSYLPFIPQNKVKLDFIFQKNEILILKNTFLKIGGVYAEKQKNPAMFETETDSYFLLNAGIGTNFKIQNQTVSISIQGNNLLDETYFDHLSTLKEINFYNMGRNLSLNIKVPFGVK